MLFAAIHFWHCKTVCTISFNINVSYVNAIINIRLKNLLLMKSLKLLDTTEQVSKVGPSRKRKISTIKCSKSPSSNNRSRALRLSIFSSAMFINSKTKFYFYEKEPKAESCFLLEPTTTTTTTQEPPQQYQL